MKIKKWIWWVMVAVILGGVATSRFKITQKVVNSKSKSVYYCPMHPTYTSDRPGDCPICNMKFVERESSSALGEEGKDNSVCLMHNCPMMHDDKPCPMMVVTEPGEKVNCPVCGIHVTGAELADGEIAPMSDHASILLSPQKLQLAGVKTVLAEKKPLMKIIRSVGRVMVDETKIVHVNPKVEGWVEELYAKYEGDAVKKNQPLFSFYSPDFVSAQEEYLLALRSFKNLSDEMSPSVHENAQTNLNSTKNRLLLWDISEEQILELGKRGTPQKTLVLASPIDGVVLAKRVFSGEYMERGADFYHLADLSTLWVEVDIYEYDLPWVKVGLEARVSLPNHEEEKFSGKLIYISPALKPKTRTAVARLELSNAENVLKPEMFVNAELKIDLGERLRVPTQAVMDTGIRKIIFVSKGSGLFEPREVVIGVKADDGVEIRSGVSEGEAVVVNGNFLIDSESRLKAAMDTMSEAAKMDTGSEGSQAKESVDPGSGTGSVMRGGHHHGQ